MDGANPGSAIALGIGTGLQLQLSCHWVYDPLCCQKTARTVCRRHESKADFCATCATPFKKNSHPQNRSGNSPSSGSVMLRKPSQTIRVDRHSSASQNADNLLAHMHLSMNFFHTAPIHFRGNYSPCPIHKKVWRA
jgi:hypothetical protein